MLARFFFNDTATTEIYTLSLHDALPISAETVPHAETHQMDIVVHVKPGPRVHDDVHLMRSEEHTSELQSHLNLVCRLLLEKKKRVAGRSRPVVGCGCMGHARLRNRHGAR